MASQWANGVQRRHHRARQTTVQSATPPPEQNGARENDLLIRVTFPRIPQFSKEGGTARFQTSSGELERHPHHGKVADQFSVARGASPAMESRARSIYQVSGRHLPSETGRPKLTN
jgi:hypothetical protein